MTLVICKIGAWKIKNLTASELIGFTMWVLLQGSPFSLGKEEYTTKGYLKQWKKCGEVLLYGCCIPETQSADIFWCGAGGGMEDLGALAYSPRCSPLQEADM